MCFAQCCSWFYSDLAIFSLQRNQYSLFCTHTSVVASVSGSGDNEHLKLTPTQHYDFCTYL